MKRKIKKAKIQPANKQLLAKPEIDRCIPVTYSLPESLIRKISTQAAEQKRSASKWVTIALSGLSS